jgi:hypothetical protein
VPEPSPLSPPSRLHLDELAGELGVFQHAVGSRPDPGHGYCTDDVARALQVDLLHARVLGWPAVEESAQRNLDFLAAAFDEETGRFRNFRAVDGAWTAGPGSEDSQGRAMHALGDVVATGSDGTLVEAAAALFDRALPAARGLTALRATSSVVLGCAARTSTAEDRPTAFELEGLAARLRARFDSVLADSWPWPEAVLTYETALPPRALIIAGLATGSEELTAAGLRVLDFLIEGQTAIDGRYSAIGNGWWARGGVKSAFDQQPIEATAMILAAESAYAATGDDRYRGAMERAYAWFLGENDLRRVVADPVRGACGDGLTADGVNTNEGAESTLMWLIAAERIRALRGGISEAPGQVLAAGKAAR